MFILSCISRGLESLSVTYTSVYENSELNVYKNVKCFDEISSNWPNDLLGTNVYQTPESFW